MPGTRLSASSRSGMEQAGQAQPRFPASCEITSVTNHISVNEGGRQGSQPRAKPGRLPAAPTKSDENQWLLLSHCYAYERFPRSSTTLSKYSYHVAAKPSHKET